MFGRVCWARGSAALKEFFAVGLCISPTGGVSFSCFSVKYPVLTGPREPRAHWNLSLCFPTASALPLLTADPFPSHVMSFFLPFPGSLSLTSPAFLSLSARCCQHTLEADSVLLGGLLNCQEG